MKTTHRIAALGVALAVAAGALTACAPSSDSGTAATDQVLNLSSKVEPSSFAPSAAATGPYLVFYLPVYDPLFVFAADGSLTGKLVDRFSWSGDNLTLTLALHQGITFTDGSDFNAAAVKANLDYYKGHPGPAGPVLANVSSVEAPDEKTVVLTLSAPDPGLLAALAGPAGYIGSPKSLGTDKMVTDPDGTGPYTLDLTQTVTGSQYVYKRKDKYWGGDLPYAELRYSIMADETARVNALKSGQLDFAPLDNPANGVDAKSAGFTMQENYATFEGIMFFDRDGKLAPELADKRVREALRLAIDTKTILKTVKLGFGQPTTQIFPEWADAFTPSLDDAYPYDPQRAKQLLAEAGYPHGFTIPFPETNTLAPELYLAITQYWKEIGVTAQPYQWGQGEAVPSMQKGQFALSYFTIILQDSWSTANFLVAPNARYNPFHTKTPEVTSLLHDMQYGTTAADRAKAGKALNKYLVDQVWFGPTFRPTQFMMTDDKVTLKLVRGYSMPPYWAFTPAK
ncbi:MAG: hypothetical protein J0I62_09345 [Microbacterium sp.]|nr:hypothetical protein [Microbacterium sp.]OJU71502.1 MAG: hypothetical protein BGO04_07330 [Microbacterium sp. 70-38]